MVATPEHVCGLSGYDGMIDPPCPGCEVRNAEFRRRLDELDMKTFKPKQPSFIDNIKEWFSGWFRW